MSTVMKALLRVRMDRISQQAIDTIFVNLVAHSLCDVATDAAVITAGDPVWEASQ